MDLLTLVGILSGMGLIIGAILLKTSLLTFIDLPSLMIVLGGTFASTFISYSGSSIMRALKDMITTFFKHRVVYTKTIEDIGKLATVAKRQGKVGLEKVKVQSDFMNKGVDLILSDLAPDAIYRTMTIEKKAIKYRDEESQAILEKMGDLSPAWGMVGTLIGLVIMMLKLDDPSAIGPSMAIALLTTFYGAVMANLLFLPTATKIEQRSNMGVKHHDLIIEGIVSIARNENPRMIKEKLMGFLTMDNAPKSANGKNRPTASGAKKPPRPAKPAAPASPGGA